MSQSETQPRPLNARQKAFGRELGIAIASGDRDYTAAYGKAGYAPHRGNAARLAANEDVKRIADEVAHEAVRLAGLHLAYLQAKGLDLLHANGERIRRRIAATLEPDDEGHMRQRPLSADEEAELDALTWAASEISVEPNGTVKVKVPDKKGVIEMLTKTMPGALAPQKVALTDPDGTAMVVEIVRFTPDAKNQAAA